LGVEVDFFLVGKKAGIPIGIETLYISDTRINAARR